MNNVTFILIAVFMPLAGALLIRLTGAWPNLRETVTLSVAVLLFATVVQLLPAVQAGDQLGIVLQEMLPGIAIAFAVEPLGMIFALIASGLWIVTSIYAIGYMRARQEDNQTRFYMCFSIALASTMGIAFSANLLTLFLFYELLTLSTYPLVTHAGTSQARQGGRTYLSILLFTSISFLLTAIIWTWSVTGTLDFTAGGILASKASPGVAAVLLLLFVFGTGKAALMPFHRWLPGAMVAPAPVSALLHAVAVVKAGVFTVLKIAVYIFGIDFLAEVPTARILAYLAGATILIGSIMAMRQDNLKRRLAYSTVSQLSYIVLGAMLASPLAVIGGAMHIVTHAFGKITLFFCAGAIDVAMQKKKHQRYARHRPCYAIYNGCLLHCQPQHYWSAAVGWLMEQMVSCAGYFGGRCASATRYTHDQLPIERRLPAAHSDTRLLLQTGGWQSHHGNSGSATTQCAGTAFHRSVLCGVIFPGGAAL